MSKEIPAETLPEVDDVQTRRTNSLKPLRYDIVFMQSLRNTPYCMAQPETNSSLAKLVCAVSSQQTAAASCSFGPPRGNKLAGAPRPNQPLPNAAPAPPVRSGFVPRQQPPPPEPAPINEEPPVARPEVVDPAVMNKPQAVRDTRRRSPVTPKMTDNWMENMFGLQPGAFNGVFDDKARRAPPPGDCNAGPWRPEWDQGYPAASDWGAADPWDAPGDLSTDSIFTLGDIRQAEMAIESQGISADAYTHSQTARMMLQQQQQPQPMVAPVDSAKNIFFNDGKNGSAPSGLGDTGGSKFLSMMMNSNNASAKQANRMPANQGDPLRALQHALRGRVPQAAPQRPARFGANPNAPNAASNRRLENLTPQQQAALHNASLILRNLPLTQQLQLASTWAATRRQHQGGDSPSGSRSNVPAADSAAAANHLLQILNVQRNNFGGAPPTSQAGQSFRPSGPPPATNGDLMGAMPMPMQQQRPLGFSKPLNPAAPNFAPSGLYNPHVPLHAEGAAVKRGFLPSQQQAPSGPAVPPPPPVGMRNDNGWAAPPENAGQSPPNPRGTDLQDVLQRLVNSRGIQPQAKQAGRMDYVGNSMGPTPNDDALQNLQRQILAGAVPPAGGGQASAASGAQQISQQHVLHYFNQNRHLLALAATALRRQARGQGQAGGNQPVDQNQAALTIAQLLERAAKSGPDVGATPRNQVPPLNTQQMSPPSGAPGQMRASPNSGNKLSFPSVPQGNDQGGRLSDPFQALQNKLQKSLLQNSQAGGNRGQAQNQMAVLLQTIQNLHRLQQSAESKASAEVEEGPTTGTPPQGGQSPPLSANEQAS